MEILEAPLRRPWLVLVPASVAAATALLITLLVPPQYRGVALIRAEWVSQDAALAQKRAADAGAWRLSQVRTFVLSRPVIQQALGTARRSLELRVTPHGADVFAIESVHHDPAQAAAVATGVAQAAVDAAEQEYNQSGWETPTLIQARLDEARRALAAKEQALRGAQTSAGATRSPHASPGRVAEGRLDAERRAVALEMSAAEARRLELRDALAPGRQSAPAAESEQAAELSRLRAQRAELRRRYTEEHPDVEALNRKIRRLEAASPASPSPVPAARLEAELRDVEAEIAALRERAARLERESAPRSAPAGAAPPPRRSSSLDIAALTAHYQEARQDVLALEEAWRAAETAYRLGRRVAVRLHLVQAAAVPNEPEFPDRLQFCLVGLALGVTLGLGLAIVAERRDRTVRGPEDLQALLPGPLLVTIPEVRSRDR